MEQSGDPADSVSYVPGDSLPTNPLSTAELREMYRGFHRRFSTVPAGNELSKLAVRERTLASLDAATGLRVNELLALGWGDVNLENLEHRVTRSIWQQVLGLGNCKAEASVKAVPMDSHMAEDLLRWLRQSIYASDDDYVFASETIRAKQPFGRTIS